MRPMPTEKTLIEQVEEICNDGIACQTCEYALAWREPRGWCGIASALESMRGCRLLGDGERMACTGHVEDCPGLL